MNKLFSMLSMICCLAIFSQTATAQDSNEAKAYNELNQLADADASTDANKQLFSKEDMEAYSESESAAFAPKDEEAVAEAATNSDVSAETATEESTLAAKGNSTAVTKTPKYLLPPENGSYPLKVKPVRAMAGAVGGYTMMGLNALLGFGGAFFTLAGHQVDLEGHLKSEKMGLADTVYGISQNVLYASGLLFQNMLFFSTAITGPIVNHTAVKTRAWSYYRGHVAIDCLSWTFYGASILFGALSFANYLMFLSDYYISDIGGSYLSFCSLVSAISSVAALALFSSKALIAFRTALAINKINKSSAENDTKKHVSIAPSMAPYMDRNRKISGGTLGLSASF